MFVLFKNNKCPSSCSWKSRLECRYNWDSQLFETNIVVNGDPTHTYQMVLDNRNLATGHSWSSTPTSSVQRLSFCILFSTSVKLRSIYFAPIRFLAQCQVWLWSKFRWKKIWTGRTGTSYSQRFFWLTHAHNWYNLVCECVNKSVKSNTQTNIIEIELGVVFYVILFKNNLLAKEIEKIFIHIIYISDELSKWIAMPFDFDIERKRSRDKWRAYCMWSMWVMVEHFRESKIHRFGKWKPFSFEQSICTWRNDCWDARYHFVANERRENQLTRPSIIVTWSLERSGLSLIIGTDWVFGMARPRSIIAGWMCSPRKWGGRSWRKASIGQK